ncbi:GGDEF domain-containing protein [Pandoraea fibrosis]|uniref:Sensor domain-containing diguanylate cyclase n=1 Tax=Pandoraea fibrosis TaxID=1891094 RepID=A0A5E4RFT6_9BURK|nr:sensor domain-containing diguanylate cyclase [Pandoraea fibrosis]VVD61703.1 sensor domain-containing diguanylate cyclase [Pandoraea fibrosis]
MTPALPASGNVDPMRDSAHDIAQAARALWRTNGAKGANATDGVTPPHLPSDDRRGRIDGTIRVKGVFDPLGLVDDNDRGSPMSHAQSPVSPEPSAKSASPFVQSPNAWAEPASTALLSSHRRALPARHDMTASRTNLHEPITPVPAPTPRLTQAGTASLNEAERLAALRRYEILDTPPEPAFDRIVRLASYVLGTPISLVSLIDETRQWFKAHKGIDTSQTPRSMAFCAHAILGDDVFVVPDARADRRFADNPLVTGEPNIRFYAGAPLRTPEGHRLGTLCVIDRRPRTLDDEKRALLADLSALVVDALELRRVNQALGDMAMRDGLTGALNRRAFLMQAERLFAAARTQQRRLSVLMLDIDHFKRVNDTWGHATGDRVIVELTLVLRATLRKGTVIGRLGGEEFAVLLPEADAQRALQASERLLAAIGNASVPGPNGPVRFSASIGVGSLAPDDVEFSTLLQRADRALYSAKQAGRNRVAVL